MPIRNRILDLHRNGRLQFATVPLPDEDARELLRLVPDVLDRMANPEIFEFIWGDSGISLDENFDTHYPDIDDQEWQEAITCPVPHPVVWIETTVRDPQNHDDRLYIWLVERRGTCGYVATPLVFYQDSLSYFGVFFELDPEAVDNFGVPGRVTVYNRLESYAREYEIDEFFRQADAIARFFRLLCLPKVQIETFEPAEKLNKARIKRGREPLAIRKTVRIDSVDLFETRYGRSGATHASPAEHFRRAHRRQLRNGRVVNVRDCIVNEGRTDAGPLPQDFLVR